MNKAAGRCISPPQGVPAPHAARANPPPWMDPWAYATLLAVLPVVLHSLGAPLGEPLADDFDYLSRSMLEGGGSLLDGGGSVLYWRPVGRQIYYRLFGPLLLAHPGVAVAFHIVALAATALLLYLVLRRTWSGPRAWAGATFVLFAESSRMLVAWPSHLQDLGAMLFIALALYEASCRRLWTSMAAILASLLCKEVGLVAALLVPWLPTFEGQRRERARWLAATTATVALWGIAYVAVTRHAGLLLPHQFPATTSTLGWWPRMMWTLAQGVRAQFSQTSSPGAWDVWNLGSRLLLLGIAAWSVAANAAARARFRAALPWAAWGIAWFVAGVMPLAELFPAWSAYRCAFAGIGLGVALLALLAPLGGAGVAALVAIRLAAFALSPGPPASVSEQAPAGGDEWDFPKLVRLERLVHDTRLVLHARYPELPHGALVCYHNLPRMSEHAFGRDRALNVWYGDTTLHWMSFADFPDHPELPLLTIVEFQQERRPQMAFVDPDAMRAYLAGMKYVLAGRYQAALPLLARAESLQTDENAAVFGGWIASERGLALFELGRVREAELEAERGASLWPGNISSQSVLAGAAFKRGLLDQARAHADSVLLREPQNGYALTLNAAIRQARERPDAADATSTPARSPH